MGSNLNLKVRGTLRPQNALYRTEKPVLHIAAEREGLSPLSQLGVNLDFGFTCGLLPGGGDPGREL